MTWLGPAGFLAGNVNTSILKPCHFDTMDWCLLPVQAVTARRSVAVVGLQWLLDGHEMPCGWELQGRAGLRVVSWSRLFFLQRNGADTHENWRHQEATSSKGHRY